MCNFSPIIFLLIPNYQKNQVINNTNKRLHLSNFIECKTISKIQFNLTLCDTNKSLLFIIFK